MKEIKNYCAEKYRKRQGRIIKKRVYREKEQGIYMYRDGEEEIYITSLSFVQEPEFGEGEGADEISQYPLEDILDKFYCYVSDFYKELNTSDSKICYLEFASPDISDIRALREIIGKHVYNKEYDESGETYTELVIE